MKKQILFIIPSLAGGGAEKVLIDLLRHFNYDVYDVTLCLKWMTGPYLKDIPKTVNVISVHGNNNLKLERSWMLFKRIHLFYILKKLSLYGIYHAWFYQKVFTDLLGSKKFDTIVSFMEGEAVKYHSYIMQRAKHNVSWIHIDLKAKHWSLDFFKNSKEEQNIYQLMEKVICVSQDTKSAFDQLYPRLSNKSMVIYNPIDRDLITKLSHKEKIKKRKFTICMAGRLNTQKRYDRALDVARRLKEDHLDVEFWILGDGELLPQLKRKVKEYQLEDSFLFKGFKNPPYSYMKEADLYLSTSDAEGYSLVICEAFCLGIPIVSTATAGPKELIKQSKGGLLANRDAEDLYIKVKRMIEDEALRKECARNGYRFSESFDISHTMRQIYEVIQ